MRYGAWFVLALAVLAGPSACSDGSTPADDAGTDGGGDADGDEGDTLGADPPAPPAGPPADPEPPSFVPCPDGWEEVPDDDGPATCDPWPDGALPATLTPCPAGWREVEPVAGGMTYCDPWPESGIATCGQDAAHFPGEPDCARVGTACPAGDWADDLPATGVLYVRAGAPAGGAGTTASPFGTIAEALAAAASGTIVALGKGLWDESITVPAGVTVRGACIAETVVAPATPSGTEAAATAGGMDGALENLRVGGERWGILVGAGTSLRLEDVVVSGVSMRAILVEDGGELTARTLVVRDTRARSSDGYYGRALQAQGAAGVDVQRAVFAGNCELGVIAFDPGTEIDLSDAAVVGMLPAGDGTGGNGIQAQEGAVLRAVRTVVEGARTAGAAATTSGAELELTDVLVRATESRTSDGAGGSGLTVEAGGRAVVRRAAFLENHQTGAILRGAGSTGDLSDVLLADTRSDPRGAFGSGIGVADGATVTMARAVVERNLFAGVHTDRAGTSLTLTETIVRDTAPQEADGLAGAALVVSLGSTVRAERVLLERNRSAGVGVAGADASLDLVDAVVRDTADGPVDPWCGVGIEVAGGAGAQLERVLFERNGCVGIEAIDDGSHATVVDVVVRGTRMRETDGVLGDGVLTNRGARLDATRLWLEDNRSAGLFLADPGTAATLEDLLVRDTLADGDGAMGRGLSVHLGATVAATRVRIERSLDFGALAADPGTTLTLTDVVVVDTLSRESDSFNGNGLMAAEGALVTVTRGLLERNAAVGVMGFGAGARLVLEDLTVRDTRSDPVAGSYGRGLNVEDGARAEVTRASFEANRQGGVVALNPGTTLVLTDVAVRDTVAARDEETFGYGLEVADGAHVEGQRVSFEGNTDVGVLIGQTGTTATLENLTIRDTRSRASDGGSGRALGVLLGARAEVRRAVIEGNREIGVYAMGPDTSLGITDLVLRETTEADCAADRCAGFGGGIGLGSYGGATIDARRFLIADHSLCGVQLAVGADPGGVMYAEGGTVDLHDGRVSGNPIGANVQTASFELSRLQDGVEYVDNERTIDSVELPVPDPGVVM